MNLSTRISAPLCAFLSSLFLAAGFGASGQWVGVGLAFVTLTAWLGARRMAYAWLAMAALPVAVILAAMGLWGGGSPYLMIPGATLALASWDLTLFHHSMAGYTTPQAEARLERMHYASLGPVVAVGLFAAVAGRVFAVQLPFIAILALAAALVFFLERAWRTFHL